MSQVKWGIIGPGRISTKFVKDLALVEGAVLQAVASRNKDRAKDFAEKSGAKMYYDSYEKMIENADLDIAYVATPHTFHSEQSLLCLQNGIPVLCEKPAAINRRELQFVIDTARNTGTFFMEALWTRFIPAIAKVLEIVESGEMGEVINVEAEFCFTAPVDLSSRLYDIRLGGGVTLDIGIYPVFLAYLLLGVPGQIIASGQRAKTGVDQTASIQLFYPDKKEAALHASILYASNMPARITMTKGYILMEPRWHESPALTVLQAGKTPGVITCPPTGKGFTHEIRECHFCIQQGKIASDLWSHSDSLNLISILDEIRRQIGVVYPGIDP